MAVKRLEKDLEAIAGTGGVVAGPQPGEGDSRGILGVEGWGNNGEESRAL